MVDHLPLTTKVEIGSEARSRSHLRVVQTLAHGQGPRPSLASRTTRMMTTEGNRNLVVAKEVKMEVTKTNHGLGGRYSLLSS